MNLNNIIINVVILTFSGIFKWVCKKKKAKDVVAAIFRHMGSLSHICLLASWPENCLPISTLSATTFHFY